MAFLSYVAPSEDIKLLGQEEFREMELNMMEKRRMRSLQQALTAGLVVGHCLGFEL